jgi:hypothetical protein
METRTKFSFPNITCKLRLKSNAESSFCRLLARKDDARHLSMLHDVNSLFRLAALLPFAAIEKRMFCQALAGQSGCGRRLLVWLADLSRLRNSKTGCAHSHAYDQDKPQEQHSFVH